MRNLFHSFAFIALAISAISLGGCATVPGNLNGLGKDPMSMLVIHKNRDYGQLTAAEYHLTVAHANDCLTDVHRQQAGLAEVMLTNGAVDALAVGGSEAGSVPTQASVLGAHLVRHAVPAVAAGGAVLGFVQGAANGAKIKSNAVTAVVGNCTNGDLHDPLTAVHAAGVHVYGSPVRTNNRSNELPSYVTRVATPARGPGDTREPDQQ